MSSNDLAFLTQLERVIDARLESADDDSYTAELGAAGVKRMAQKVGEEALEVALASVAGDDGAILDEAADLVYHLLVLLRTRQLALSDVARVLEARHES